MHNDASATKLLDTAVPDGLDDQRAKAWIRETLPSLRELDPSNPDQEGAVAITWRDILDETPSLTMDAPVGRKFILATLLADWACYARDEHRDALPHLRHVIATFPWGFRLWMHRTGAGRRMPVGYSGWHPIDEATFRLLRDSPERLTDRRAIKPLAALAKAQNHVYIFNCSIIGALRKTETSRGLMRALAADIGGLPPSGLAAVAVSPDGRRVLARFGLRHAGDMTHEGETEASFVRDME